MAWALNGPTTTELVKYGVKPTNNQLPDNPASAYPAGRSYVCGVPKNYERHGPPEMVFEDASVVTRGLHPWRKSQILDTSCNGAMSIRNLAGW